MIESGGLRIGVAAVLGTEQLKRVTQEDVFKSAPMEALKATLAQMNEANCDVQVLLSHASIGESSLFAKAFPQLDLVVTAGGGRADVQAGGNRWGECRHDSGRYQGYVRRCGGDF